MLLGSSTINININITTTSMFLFSWVLLVLAPTVLDAAPLEDLIEHLPGYGRPPTTQFSGFLDATAGCDTSVNGKFCKVHYWLSLADTENQNDPLKAPVVLWSNGGPGSSSVLGLLQENGPLLMNATGGLMENPWAWTKLANLLILEAPIGVGYSYCEAQATQGKTCQNTDRYTASASRAALQDFFTTKFPELSQNEFFITGESYAGVYIPTLTKEIFDHAPEINLKGIAVGDPCTDNTAQEDSMDALWYGGKYGLVDEQVYDLLWNHCEARAPNLMRQGGIHHVLQTLNHELRQVDDPQERAARAKEHLHKLAGSGGPTMRQSAECTLAFRKFLMSASKGLSQSWDDLYIDDYSLFAPVSQLEDEQMAAYMVRADVKAALHVTESPTKTWPYASQGFDYTKEYDACNDRVVIVDKSMIDIYQEIVPKLHTTYIYNGDTDPCVSYEGTRLAVKRIGFDEVDGGGYRPWFYNHTGTTFQLLAEKAPLFGPDLLCQDMGAQFGGEIVDYEHNLSFLTFHGSGHMVPQFRPQAALHMLEKLIKRQSLSPLMPSNSTLASLSNSDFKDAMDAWTEKARGTPFVDQLFHLDTTTTANSNVEIEK
jgi:serine carboxypeptidase-like clade 1